MKKNNIGKKLFTLLIISAMMMCFAACGDSSSDSGEAVTYTALTEATYPPFDTMDEDGNIVGFDMDLLDAIGEDQGFKVEYVTMEFASLVPAIQSKSGDIIAAAMTPTEERAKNVDFTDIYKDGGIALLSNTNGSIASIEDVTSDMVLAAQTGTTQADIVQEMKDKGEIKDVVLLDSNDAMMLQLSNGDIDGAVMGQVSAKAYVASGNFKVKIAGDPIASEDTAFAVAKGNTELKDKVNAGLKNVIADGTYAKLCEKWGVEDTMTNR